MKRILPPLDVVPLRPLSLRPGRLPGRPAHLSAASGLVCDAGRCYVIADDELHLACFDAQGGRAGELVRLLPGTLPVHRSHRKRRKPDLEVLMRLPPMAHMPQGALLALGSGSRAPRRAGIVLPFGNRGRGIHQSHRIDASPLFARLARELGEINIEGGWTTGGRFYLLQRGNQGSAANAIVGWESAPLLRALAHERVLPDLAPLLLREMSLGTVDGVTIGFTDGTPLPDGRWLFSAVAEDTRNAYRDGRFVGAFVGIAGRRHGVHGMRRISPDFKIEGIAVEGRRTAPRVLLVSDADDADRPAWLLEARLPL